MLKLEAVEVAYGHIQALAGISLEVREGELVALLGANGAGKTTTLMTISGIVRPRGGSLLYGRTDLAKASPFDIVGQGVIQCPEGRRIFGGLSVLENLRMGAVRRRDTVGVRRDLDSVLSLFPVLGERRHQSGATLSGGEQQMLAIGRALMAKPSLLMLDEPSLGLAPVMVKLMFEIIQALNGEGITLLLVEQNVYQTLAIASYVYVLRTGRLEMEGTGNDLLKNPDFQRAYLGVRN
jgi:branched-chain amino acid transport system ATP-binding protein